MQLLHMKPLLYSPTLQHRLQTKTDI